MKRIIILVIILILVVFGFMAQGQVKKADIVTDRPDQTEAPVLVPQGGVQIETGFFFEKDLVQNIEVTNVTYNTTLIKYGVNENLEFRFITEYLGEYIKDSEAQATRINGFSPIAIGAKVKLADENGFWPQAALIGHINLKTGYKEFAPSYTAADFRFTFAHTLSDRWALSYNVGAEWNGESPEAIFLYTLSLGYSINSKLAAFLETYSFFPEDAKADNRMDGGFTFKITPVIQFDVSGGIGLSDNAPDYFLSTGASFRLFK